jgi:cbb3-type cytochrome oxidase maturation protein
MGIVPVLALAALSMSALGLALFVWAVGAGQFEELDAEAARALMDGPPLPSDDEPRGPVP